MSKKELRKELELLLIKTLEEVLNKKDAEATKKIKKTTHEASKMVAKKFFKIIKPVAGNKITAPRKVVKKAIVSSKNDVAPFKKKNSTKIKTKITK